MEDGLKTKFGFNFSTKINYSYEFWKAKVMVLVPRINKNFEKYFRIL
jgi:hypothetical protein